MIDARNCRFLAFSLYYHTSITGAATKEDVIVAASRHEHHSSDMIDVFDCGDQGLAAYKDLITLGEARQRFTMVHRGTGYDEPSR